MRTLLKTIPLALAALIFVAAPAGATEDPPETPDPISEVLTSENITVTITPDDPQPKDIDGTVPAPEAPAPAPAAAELAFTGSRDNLFWVGMGLILLGLILLSR